MAILDLAFIILIRAGVSMSIFGLILLFPQYLKQNTDEFRNRRRTDIFLFSYLKWYVSQLIRTNQREREANEFLLVITGLIMLAVLLSLVPDDYISGIGVEITGAVISAWTFLSYWSVRDELTASPDNQSDESQSQIVSSSQNA